MIVLCPSCKTELVIVGQARLGMKMEKIIVKIILNIVEGTGCNCVWYSNMQCGLCFSYSEVVLAAI